MDAGDHTSVPSLKGRFQNEQHRVSREANWLQTRFFRGEALCSVLHPKLHKHIQLLTSLTPTQMGRGLTNLQVIIKGPLLLCHQISSPNLPESTNSSSHTGQVLHVSFFSLETNRLSLFFPFFFFFLQGGTEIPGQQEPSMELVSFHGEPGRPGLAH